MGDMPLGQEDGHHLTSLGSRRLAVVAHSDDTLPEPPVDPDAGLIFYPGHLLSRGDTVLQSSDDVCFRTDLALLATHSSFFSDLEQLPFPPSGRLLPLCTTGSAALKFVLDVVHDSTPEVACPRLPVPVTVDLLDEVIAFADAYDMPLLYYPLYLATRKTGCSPCVLFTLAALERDKELVAHHSPQLLAFQDDVARPAWWARTLAARAPDTFAEVLALFTQWKNAFARFVALSPYSRIVSLGFGTRCRWPPCATHRKYNGNFEAFRAAAVPPLWDVVRKHPTGPTWDAFATAIKGVPCSVCRNRLANDMRVVWKDTMGGQSWRIRAKWGAGTNSYC